MEIKDFGTENFFGEYEFEKPYILSASDCESIEIKHLIELGQGSPSELMDLRLGYTPLNGGLKLRREISSLYEHVSPDEIIVLGSPAEGIFLTCQAILNKNDHVIALTPAYDSLLHSAEFACGNISNWNMDLSDNKWSLDLNNREKLFQSNTKLLIINFPHNPTGYHPNEDEFRAILSIAKKRDIWVLSDEMYRGLEYDEADRLPAASDLYEKAITLNGASKSLGLPGLRFGWLVLRDKELRQTLTNWKNYTSMCSPQTLEFLGIMAIRSRNVLFQRNVDIIKNNLEAARNFFLKFSELFNWIPPMAGSVSIFELKSEPAEQYCHKVAKDSGVVLLPSKFMGTEDIYIRFGFGRKNFSENLVAFEKYLLKSN